MAGVLGLVALRVKGLYLALITLTYGFVAVNSIFQIPVLTNGGAGMPAPRPAGFTGDTAYAFLCLGFLAAALYFDWNILRSKAGRSILAVKHSEDVAASYGVDVTAYKVIAFVLSGALAGLAGSLFAHHNLQVVPSDFGIDTALLWVLMVVVGGLGYRWGVVLASALFALLPYALAAFGNGNELNFVVGALLAAATIVFNPGGVGRQLRPLTRWLSGGPLVARHRSG
jgi:branched-chain amino acid transport system permease protein